jgi:hypothetical protein
VERAEHPATTTVPLEATRLHLARHQPAAVTVDETLWLAETEGAAAVTAAAAMPQLLPAFQVKDLLAVAAILGSQASCTAAVEVDPLQLVPVGIQAAQKRTEALVPRSLAPPMQAVAVAETPGHLRLNRKQVPAELAAAATAG